MSTITANELDELIKKATSETIPNGEIDLPVALEISDIIRSKRLIPKESMRCLKKRMTSTGINPNIQLASWKLAEICIKNGGIPFIVEICSREFMDYMEVSIIKYNHDGNEIEELIRRLFYELYVAFKDDSQLNYVNTVYKKLIQKGVHFPDENNTNTTEIKAMFDSKIPADWIDSDACMICSNKFSFLNRRHHCRSCGGIFCQDHSSNFITLPDLGIYEKVRVCDNCFNDYDSKKSSGPKKPKKKSKKRHSHEEEEEQLRRAIELSLRESRGDAIEPVVPNIEREAPSQHIAEEENDPDLKAAIEASLREAEEEKARREREAQFQTQELYQQQQHQQQQAQPQRPSFELSSEDEDAIYLFASMVEKMKTQSMTEILQNDAAQRLFSRVQASKPKLNHTLAETNQKYNSLLEMNGKISDVMNIYDNLLEQQLHNINISSQYNIPQAQPAVQIPPQPTNHIPSAYSQYERYYQQAQMNQLQAPVQQVPIQQLPVQQVPVQQVPMQQVPIQQAPVPQTNESNLEQLRSVEIRPEPNTETANTLPYPKESEENLIEPSEPVYPNEEEELPENQKTQETTNEPIEIPYPTENDKVPNNKANITRYNFPTVPVQKLPEKPTEEEETHVEEAQPKEEELLLEL